MNLLFAWRYFRSKKTTNAINIIAWIAITAIAVGTASLIIILSAVSYTHLDVYKRQAQCLDHSHGQFLMQYCLQWYH